MAKDIQQKRFEAKPATERFANERLPKALGWPDGRIRVDPAEDGQNSLIYFVRHEAGESAVVQAFAKPADHKRLKRALELPGKRDVPTPGLLYSGTRWRDSRRYDYCFIAMEKREGRNLTGDMPTSDARAALADGLARLHGVESRRLWGKPGDMKWGNIRADWNSGVERRLAQLRAEVRGLSEDQFTFLEKWFGKTLTRLPEPSEFQLCHHHLGRDDILYDPKAGISFIDCASLQYSRAARDLAMLHNNTFVDAAELWNEFLDRYFDHFSKADRLAWTTELRFFDAFYHLSKLRRSGLEPLEAEERFDKLVEIIESD